jgi:hypothetical protein
MQDRHQRYHGEDYREKVHGCYYDLYRGETLLRAARAIERSEAQQQHQQHDCGAEQQRAIDGALTSGSPRVRLAVRVRVVR